MKWWTNVWIGGRHLNANTLSLFVLANGAKDLIFARQDAVGERERIGWFSFIFMWKIYFNLCNKYITYEMGCGAGALSLSLRTCSSRCLANPHEYVSCIICVARLSAFSIFCMYCRCVCVRARMYLVFAIYRSGALKSCRRVMYCWTLAAPTET